MASASLRSVRAATGPAPGSPHDAPISAGLSGEQALGSGKFSASWEVETSETSAPSGPARRLRRVALLGRWAGLAVLARRVARLALDRLDPDSALPVLVGRGPSHRGHEAARRGARHFEHRLAGGDADGADLGLGDVPSAAEQRK